MQYRANASATIGATDDFPETTIVEGQMIDSERTPAPLVDYLYRRGFIDAPNVESAEAAPGQKRSTRRSKPKAEAEPEADEE